MKELKPEDMKFDRWYKVPISGGSKVYKLYRKEKVVDEDTGKYQGWLYFDCLARQIKNEQTGEVEYQIVPQKNENGEDKNKIMFYKEEIIEDENESTESEDIEVNKKGRRNTDDEIKLHG